MFDKEINLKHIKTQNLHISRDLQWLTEEISKIVLKRNRVKRNLTNLEKF